ncbi:MAG: hypothetical protein KDB69_08755 [Acidimicrobiia bacterium]|nr:hypothetical protein [Acidimicrobiia bacterium]
MTTIKTTCDQCGEIHLGTSDIALELEGRGDEGTYRFVCPECFAVQRRPASQRVVSVLLATGVSYEVTLSPAGPITEAELDRFVSDLESDDWFKRLVRHGDSSEPFPST